MGQEPSFAIMGSGGIGGYLGACLCKAGYTVSFIARGPHLAAMKEHGLRVDDRGEEFRIQPVSVFQDPSEIGPVDFVVFSVKLWDTESAAELCRPLIGPNTAVVSLQNGVDSEIMLARILGREHVMGGVAEFSAYIVEPGKVSRVSPIAIVRFGELDNSRTERTSIFSAAVQAAGFEADHADDTSWTLWDKFLFLVGFSSMTCLTRRPIGLIRDDPDTKALLVQVMEEVVAIAQAKGVALTAEDITNRLGYVDMIPADAKASMAVDLDRGNRLELPWLSGAVVRMGEELGIDTPANRFVCAALKLHVDGGDGT